MFGEDLSLHLRRPESNVAVPPLAKQGTIKVHLHFFGLNPCPSPPQINLRVSIFHSYGNTSASPTALIVSRRTIRKSGPSLQETLEIMNLDPPFGTEAPINWHDLPQNQGQPAPQEQSSGPKVGWSQVLFVADSQHSHRQNHDAKTTSFLSRSHFDVNSNMPAFDTGNHALGDYNAPSNPYHNPFQNPPTNSVCAPSLGPSTTWPLDLNATRFHAALSQHDEAFQVGTMFQFSNFPHHGLYHATETAAPSCVSLPSQAHPVDGFGQYRVRRPSEARHQAHLNYGTLSRTGHAAPRPPTPRPIIPKPMPRSELTTPKKGKQQKAQITQIAASYSKSICPGNGWMEGEAHRAASLKRKRSLSPYNKRARVPKKLEHYYNCYQANIPPLPNPETDTRRRTRSAKVCFRCQDQKLKVSS